MVAEQNSFGILPILYGTSFSNESVVGGTSVNATVTLQSAAPSGGTTVRLVSSDPNIVRPPSTVFIPAGATGVDFSIPTSAVSVATRVVIETGTDVDGYRAPQTWLAVTPAGSSAPPPSLSSLTLSSSTVLSGSTVTGTLRLTSPAPAGGAVVRLQGSMEGQVIVPQSVTIPAGSISATFTTTPAPETPFPRWVFIQGNRNIRRIAGANPRNRSRSRPGHGARDRSCQSGCNRRPFRSGERRARHSSSSRWRNH